jgi:hypothetical protein
MTPSETRGSIRILLEILSKLDAGECPRIKEVVHIVFRLCQCLVEELDKRHLPRGGLRVFSEKWIHQRGLGAARDFAKLFSQEMLIGIVRELDVLKICVEEEMRTEPRAAL